MHDINTLPNTSELTDIESDFKVYAGPGAGKTTWLISHIEKVLRTSNRLGKTGRIACITYTNVAADEIVNRLTCDKERFDITTIHSFLYRNIVKPFSYLIEFNDKGEELFNVLKLDGHDEHIVHGDRFRRWLATIGKLNGKNYNIYNGESKPKVIAELSSLDYEFVNGEINLIIRKNRGARIPKSNGELWIYKSKYWLDGIMHHEDVLFFSYIIIQKSPKILEFIRSKFPYIFIDEFQDTTELQTWIINKICESNTKVGIVGDLAQSIYKFTGAKRTDFVDFRNGDSIEFKLSYNHRSTKKITTFLNTLRTDIEQQSKNKPEGIPVTILVGKIESAKNYFQEKYPEESLHILTRKNTSVSEINNQLGSVKVDLLSELYSNDGNSARAKLIHSILMGFKYHQKHDLKNALKSIVRPIKRVTGKRILKLDLRGIAINTLSTLNNEIYRSKTIFEFYSDFQQYFTDNFGIGIGNALRKGKAKTFYETYTIDNILTHVKIDTNSDDLVRTIHSSKGTEFKNTLVHFESLVDFKKYVLDGSNSIDIENDDGRIYYVACSRAIDKLFLSLPEVTDTEVEAITGLNMELLRV